jgi:flagellar FliJ protein
MKRFRFSLQKLLDLREFREHQAEINLGKAISERDKLAAELEEVGAAKMRSGHQILQHLGVSEMMTVQLYIQRLDQRKELLLEEIAQAEVVIEQRRLEMEEAMKNRKVLTKLYEKQAAVYRKEAGQEEAAVIDDIIASSKGEMSK